MFIFRKLTSDDDRCPGLRVDDMAAGCNFVAPDDIAAYIYIVAAYMYAAAFGFF